MVIRKTGNNYFSFAIKKHDLLAAVLFCNYFHKFAKKYKINVHLYTYGIDINVQ